MGRAQSKFGELETGPVDTEFERLDAGPGLDQDEAPRLALFQPYGARPPLDPFLACSLRQVVEIRDATELLEVDDPDGYTLGYVRWNGRPVPVLNPIRWGSEVGLLTPKRRIILVRGATIAKVVAIPIEQFWIEDPKSSPLTQIVAVEATRRLWKTNCLALLQASFGEALLLDLDAILHSVVA